MVMKHNKNRLLRASSTAAVSLRKVYEDFGLADLIYGVNRAVRRIEHVFLTSCGQLKILVWRNLDRHCAARVISSLKRLAARGMQHTKQTRVTAKLKTVAGCQFDAETLALGCLWLLWSKTSAVVIRGLVKQ
jgi:hypothetical protein